MSAHEGSDVPCPIVGIGSSAGGLDAFRRLLRALPIDTGMAFVLVQHLDPNHESILASLLSGETKMAVTEVQQDERVLENRIYVIPPSKTLTVSHGFLRLEPRDSSSTPFLPIDALFRALAEMDGRCAIGVVLSGMGADGTLGLRAIAAAGGVTLVQEPGSAKYDAMPRSAIAAGVADMVLTPEAIGEELGRLARHPYVSDAEQIRREDPRAGEPAAPDLGAVLVHLRQATGTDFGAYKRATLGRRIARRMLVHHLDSHAAYAALLEKRPDETAALFEDCLISVTSFFRDAAVFDALAASVIPALIDERPDASPVRVWVAGCATGEEVYSIAICLLERAAAMGRPAAIKIFGTDLSEHALAKARAGIYPDTIEHDVSPERLSRFFTASAGHYQVSKSVRDVCIFARHDLTRDAPYSRMDLVSCRNVLIYLELPAQETVLASLHYAINPGGFLLLGPAETVGPLAGRFAAMDEKHRLYMRKQGTGPTRVPSTLRASGNASVLAATTTQGMSTFDVLREADRATLARYAPAGVVIDGSLRVLEFRGDTDPFFDHGHGRATLDLARLLRKGLLVGVRKAIEDAQQHDAPAHSGDLRVHYRGDFIAVSASVFPLRGRSTTERCFLVLFELESQRADPSAGHRQRSEPERTRDEELVRLDRGLAQTTDYMHALLREHEVALEELQSSNEEALSSNEEMQSVNEELQTAQEEIQSANEELETLNQELHDRNNDLSQTNLEFREALASANALIDTVRQPLLVLDAGLRVERANAAFHEAFDTTPDQIRGGHVAEVCGGQWNRPELLDALKEVLAARTSFERFLITIGSAHDPRPLWIGARELHLERGTQRHLLVSFDDRTEALRIERERDAVVTLSDDARRRAEASDVLKDQLVATVSHELRGPLNVISGWTNILLGAAPSPDPTTQARALAAIVRSVKAQGRLLSDLLDHSRFATGGLHLERTPVDLVNIAQSALGSVRASAEVKGVELELTGRRAVSIVLGDPDRLQQVMWNLFFNAVKFTPRGGSVRATVTREGQHAIVVVRDTGSGIPADFLTHVFDRFRQADSASTRTQPGLGLGLTLVRELVELHGGTVHVESGGAGKGATFTVRLPIAAMLLPLEAEAPSVGPLASSPEEGRPLEGTYVLVVDDEADAREAVVDVLARHGARTSAASSVAEALALVAAELPDLLVTDLGMPVEDGYELIRRLRLLPADAGGALRAVVLSGYATGGHRARALTAGFEGYLEKPVAPIDLVATLVRLRRRD
ncbi:MAG: response regulator [Deltaproteobacteria bacterium]|nr:response regulator [Deltaproteobacteria bacterium]